MLEYMELDPIHRKYHHNLVTFSLCTPLVKTSSYLFPMMKWSMGNTLCWIKCQGLLAEVCQPPGFLGYMMGHPARNSCLWVMSSPFIEWKYDDSLDWHLLDYPMHRQLYEYNKALHYFYRSRPALWEQDYSWEGFEWIDPHDHEQSVISFLRKGRDPNEFLVIVVNFTPVVRENYKVGVPVFGVYNEVFNSDHIQWGGSGQGNVLPIAAVELPWHSQSFSMEITLPPLAAVFFELSEKGK